MESISTSLEQRPSNLVVKKVLKHGLTNWKEADILIFQFYIDAFGKNFQFLERHYDEIQESTVDFEDFLYEIYEAEDREEEGFESKLKHFMNSLIYETFIAELLTDSVISNWVTFLASAAEHQNIPKESKLKGIAYLLLAFMLDPLTKIMTLFSNTSININEDLKVAIKRSVERIMNNISNSFEYEQYSMSCAKEYTEALQNYHEILLNNSVYLSHFRTMLLYDSRPLLALAIEGLDELCKIDRLDEIMENFLFTANNNEQTVVQIILKLINFKNLRHDVFGFLKTLSKFRENRQIVTGNDCYEIFLNIFSKSKKTVAETVELMVTLNVDFWKELIEMLNFYTDEDVDLKFILLAIESVIDIDLEVILDFIVNNLNNPTKSRRAAEVFNEAFELNDKKELSIASLINAMKESRAVEDGTFIILLQTFIAINDEMLVTFLKLDVNYLTQILMPLISNAFLDSPKPIFLSLTVRALKKLYSIEPVTILSRIRDIFDGLHKVLLTLKTIEFTEREKLVPKMSALLENKAWRILNDTTMTELYTFCQKFCTNRSYNHFPEFQRFYVNLLKHFWMLLATDKPLLIENDTFIKDTRHIHSQISSALKSTKNTISDNCLLLSSLIDLYILFQPKITERLGNVFFKNFNIPLSKEDFIQLIDLIESNLFPESDDSSYYQQMLMQCFVMLYKNYINLPSTTSWEVFLRHYNQKCLYKSEIEVIMTHAIGMKKTIFEKSVAFAILNIAGTSSMEFFRTFFHTFDSFMRSKFTDYKERNVSYGLICSIILERFSRNINDDIGEDMNRLLILNFVELIIKNSDQSFSKNLVKFIRINDDVLTINEQEKLDNFKRMLNEGTD